jgi:hypothetical protein
MSWLWLQGLRLRRLRLWLCLWRLRFRRLLPIVGCLPFLLIGGAPLAQTIRPFDRSCRVLADGSSNFLLRPLAPKVLKSLRALAQF